jgi:hypothetical protein
MIDGLLAVTHTLKDIILTVLVTRAEFHPKATYPSSPPQVPKLSPDLVANDR